MGREAKLMVAVGMKGVGKSYATEKMMQEYVRGSSTTPPRRVLIMDVNDEYNYRPISLEQVPLFSIHPQVEIRRIRPFLEANGSYTNRMTLDDITQTLFTLLDTYRNGLLLIEDVNRYISDSMPNDLSGAICTNRHIGLDIILHYQSIGRITSKVWQNANIIRFHKQTESVKKHSKKFEDKYEYLSIMESMVDAKYDARDERFFCYADIDRRKIYGRFSNADFDNAINDFMRKDYKQLINPMLHYRDERGKAIYNHQTAQEQIKSRLLKYKK